jgi:adenine-specific DNA methylase
MAKLQPTAQKLRGGYYTPADVADAIAKWAIRKSDDKILEPSFGDGVFLGSSIRRLSSLGAQNRTISKALYGCEIEEAEFRKVLATADIGKCTMSNLSNGDFFQWYSKSGEEIDVALGNPPFIRFQNFPEPSRSYAMALTESLGIKLNRLTNIWVPFVILSSHLLGKDGRLGMVIPAELLHVSYAGRLRKYLADAFDCITILSCNELIFEDAEQEVLILLAEGKSGQGEAKIDVIQTTTRQELVSRIGQISKPVQHKYLDHSTEKWIKYFLTQEEVEFMREMRSDPRVNSFGTHFQVDVGVVTGRNDFFIVNKKKAKDLGLESYVRPAISRSSQLKDEILSADDWNKLWNGDIAVGLLDFSQIGKRMPKAVASYIASGEEAGIHEGYKCAIRKTWYKVPSLWIPDAFMFRQIHDFPHLVKNQACALSTDTIHRVKKISASHFNQSLFYTYLTAASAEIEGRSYGGGVLELEPSEAERLLVPNPELLSSAKTNYSVSRKENGKFLKRNSDLVLGDMLGFKESEIALLQDIYLRLSNRRKDRKKHQS